ncbi:MAG TPA: RHS repeat-associated core domain-containing protein [Roseiflexaceae bacterium]|nr:RHS repeat-associated core domain-containing protein [Roseiflexaceae bacterium]
MRGPAAAIPRQSTPVDPDRTPKPARPALSIDVALTPNALALGETTTLTLTVRNPSAQPVDNVTVSLPVPQGTEPLPGDGLVDAASGWRWSVGTLAGGASATRTASVRITSLPTGGALLAKPEASARDLPEPARTNGGAAIVDRSATTSAFTPGAAAALRSADGMVSVDVPRGLFKQALTLRASRTTPAGEVTPPASVLGRRSLGTVFLNATDSQGQNVHRFDQPLTISMRYTPEQLQAAGLTEGALAIFWFDTAAQRWVRLPSQVNPETRTVTALVDHFTPFALSDGSSPSAAYIPNLQGFQTSLLTGAASYSYPIELPAGPGGLKPSLALSYSSASSDGMGGTRTKWQSGWVGKGWSLDPAGYVARNKSTIGKEWDTFTLVFGGRSYHLVKGRLTGQATNGRACTNPATEGNYFECWTWHSVDEDFVRVRAMMPTGMSTPIWRVWTKDGTRYDFGINNHVLWSDPDTVSYDAQRWLLVKITDVHGNKVVFDYQIDTAQAGFQPTYALLGASWAYDGPLAYDELGAPYRTGTPRYQVWFNDRQAVDRQTGYTAGVDTQWEYPAGSVQNPDYWKDLTVRQKYRLDTIKVVSCTTAPCGHELVRQYNLTYANAANSLRTDDMSGQGQRVLTLLSVEQLDKNGQAAASPNPMKISFGYGQTTTGTNVPTPNWNRLTTITRGQETQPLSRVSFSYDNTWTPATTPAGDNYNIHYINYRRVSQTLLEDLSGTGAKSLTAYTYTSPRLNDYNHAATVVYAQYPPSGNGDSRSLLISGEKSEFRGHEQVTVKAYDGDTTGAALLKDERHWFYTGHAGCTPLLTTLANGKQAVVETDTCFQNMVKNESFKGKEYQSEVWNAGAGAPLKRINHSFARAELPFWGDSATAAASNNFKRVGLWRSFSYERQVTETTLEGAATALNRTTVYTYETTYGTLTGSEERDETGAAVRRTTRQYIRADTGTSYLVDRVCQEDIRNGQNLLLSLSATFYDNATAACGSIGTRGLPTRTTRYFDLPNVASTDGLTLNGSDTTYQYDDYGNPAAVSTYTSPSTRTNSSGGISYSAPQGTPRTTTTEYDTIFHNIPVRSTNAAGHVYKAEYDYRLGNLTKVVGPNSSGGATTDCTQGSFSIPVAEETTCARYDSWGRMVKLIKSGDSLAYATGEFFYYDAERPFRYLAVLREDAGMAYSRPLTTIYNGLGQKIQTKAETVDSNRNVITDWKYDGLGRQVAQSQPRFVDQTGSAFWSYTAPAGGLYRPTSTTYDALGRTTRTTLPDNTYTSYAHSVSQDSYGLRGITDVIDPARHRTQQRYDSLGRLRQVVEFSGDCGAYGYTCAAPYTAGWAEYARTGYAYDALDQLTLVGHPNNVYTRLYYDSAGRKTQTVDPDMGSWNYYYDAAGNLTGQVTAGKTTWFNYDVLDRLLSKSFSDGTHTSWFRYDENLPGGIGRRTGTCTILPGQNCLTYEVWNYDGRGRTTSYAHGGTGLSYHTLLYTYDSADRTKTIGYYPTSEVVTYQYDAGWHPYSLCTSLGGCYVNDAVYTALDQPSRWTYGSGVATTWTYLDNLARLSNLQIGQGNLAGGGFDAVSLFDRGYVYDSASNLTRIDNFSTSQSHNYSYDHRDRLTRSWGPGYDENYSYDVLGNLTNKAGVAYTYPTTGRIHAPTTVGATEYSYSATGNVLSSYLGAPQHGDGRNYTWDGQSQLLKVESKTVRTYYCTPICPQSAPASPLSTGKQGTTDAVSPMAPTPEPGIGHKTLTTYTTLEEYIYNADNARVGRIAGGQTTVYFGGLWEDTLGVKQTKYYTFNGKIVAQRDVATNTVLYQHGDHLGSVSLVTNSSKAMVSQQEFDAWGKVRSGGVSQTSVNYTGQRLDGTGLLYYNARYYDPAIGRFMSADTVVPGNSSGSMDGFAIKPLTVSFSEEAFLNKLNLETRLPFWFQMSDEQRRDAGRPWGPANPQALNRYSYVQNNPLRYTDPSGHVGMTINDNGTFTLHLSHQDIQQILETAGGDLAALIDTIAVGLEIFSKLPAFFKALAFAITFAWVGGQALKFADWFYGDQGVDIVVRADGTILKVGAPTVSRQAPDLYFDNKLIECALVGTNCEPRHSDPCVGKAGYCGDTGVPLPSRPPQTPSPLPKNNK